MQDVAMHYEIYNRNRELIHFGMHYKNQKFCHNDFILLKECSNVARISTDP